MADQETKIQKVGRRKTATARVLLRPGNGSWSVNGRALDDYFPRSSLRARADEALRVTESEGLYDVEVRVRGGGLTGQASDQGNSPYWR